MSQETYEQTFNVEEPAQLKISNVRGWIDVQPGDDGVITVQAVKYLDSGNTDRTEIIIEQEDDGRVVVASKYEHSVSGWLNLNRPCKVEFTVRVPKQCSVTSRCVSSKASIQGLEGEFDFNTVSGAMELKDLTGPVKFVSVSGAVKADGLSGELQMGNVSGAIKVRNSEVPSAVGKTVSGHVTLETPLGDGPYDIKTVSGYFKLITSDDAGCTVKMKSVSGRAKSSLPITSREKIGPNKTIVIQDGGPDINVKSVSGFFQISGESDGENPKEFSKAPKVERTPVEPPPQPKDRMNILKQIDNGDLSVEQALEELNA